MRDCVLVTYKTDHILPSMNVHLTNGTSKPTLMTLGLIFSYELN
jgi:hypothetical protein